MKTNSKKVSVLIVLFIGLTFSVSAEQISFMAFNVWHGAAHINDGQQAVADIIAEVNPDVISCSEVRYKKVPNWGENIVKYLSQKGKKYYCKYVEKADVCLISKFPVKSAKTIFTYSNSAVKYILDVGNGKEITVIATHLDFQGYSCNLARGYNSATKKYKGWKMIDDGSGRPKSITDTKEILADCAKSKRTRQITEIIQAVKMDKNPVIIIGDFNEPSYLDWTERTKDMFEHNGAVVQWPVTKLLSQNGFYDAFRVVFPDEVKNPGITWPSAFAKTKCTSWAPKSDDRDRVDYIFYKGKNIKPVKVSIVGPVESFAHGKKTNSYTKNEVFITPKAPWPSDHKGVYALLQIKF